MKMMMGDEDDDGCNNVCYDIQTWHETAQNLLRLGTESLI